MIRQAVSTHAARSVPVAAAARRLRAAVQFRLHICIGAAVMAASAPGLSKLLGYCRLGPSGPWAYGRNTDLQANCANISGRLGKSPTPSHHRPRPEVRTRTRGF